MLDPLSLVLAALAVLITLTWILLPSAEHRRFIQTPVGPSGLPLLGNILQIPHEAADLYDWLLNLCARYKHHRLCKLMLLRRRYVLLWSAEAVEEVLRSTKEITKSQDYKMGEPWLGEGLLTSTGEKWFNRRRLLTPSFHFRILQGFLQVMNEQAEILMNKLASHIDRPAFDIRPMITLCTLDIICETSMGAQVNAQDNSESEYVKAIHTIGDLLIKRTKMPLWWPDWLFYNIPPGRKFTRCLKIVKGYTKQVVRERWEEFQDQPKGDHNEVEASGGKKRLAFLDSLLHLVREESDFTLDDVQEEVDTFMFAGHDTTSTSLAWAVYNIGAHPDVQHRLQQELDSVLGGGGRPITDEDLKKLKYLECVIKESLRVFPTVPFVARQLSQDMTIAGHDIPKDTTVVIHNLLLHRDERFFPETEKFDPDRFTLENAAGRHAFAYIPFSAGPRNCIGQKFAMMEMKVVLSSILRRYHVEVTQKRDDLRPEPDLVLRPGKGINIKLTYRTLTD